MHRLLAILCICMPFLQLTFTGTALAQTYRVRELVATLEQERSRAAMGSGGEAQPGILLPMLSGAARALTDVNAYFEVRNLPKLYCQPHSLKLNYLNYADIVIAEYNRDAAFYEKAPDTMSNPLDLMVFMLRQGLTKTFPCSN